MSAKMGTKKPLTHYKEEKEKILREQEMDDIVFSEQNETQYAIHSGDDDEEKDDDDNNNDEDDDEGTESKHIKKMMMMMKKLTPGDGDHNLCG